MKRMVGMLCAAFVGLAAARMTIAGPTIADPTVGAVHRIKGASSAGRPEHAPRGSAIPRLHELPTSFAALPPASRDPFAFRASAHVAAQTYMLAAGSRTLESGKSLVAQIPAVTLIGIAEDLQASGVVRTAIISSSDQLFLVKEGDSVTARYRVSSVSSDAADLTDGDNGMTLRLALK